MSKRIILIVVALMPLFVLQAQQSGGLLPPNDPRLYQVFFRFHDGVNTAIQTRNAQNLENRVKAEKSLAGKLRIQQVDLEKVTEISRGFVADLTKWQSDVKAYADNARSQKKEPDQAGLRQFDQRKRQLIDVAIQQMGARLSAASWAGLRGYINDEHRLHVRVVELRAGPK